MTLNEIIAACTSIAAKYGFELLDKSDNPAKDCATLRIEYHKDGNFIGGASFIGVAEHPEYFHASDIEQIEAQIKWLSCKCA